MLDESQENTQHALDVTADDLLEAKELAANITLDELHTVRRPASLFSSFYSLTVSYPDHDARVQDSHARSQLPSAHPRPHQILPRCVLLSILSHPLHLVPPSPMQRLLTPAENDSVLANPEKHDALITELKIEAALITNNSPYAEVRSVVDNHDDPTLPVSTIRAWIIGIILAVACAFINIFFEIRQPAITVSANVAQLLAFPMGKFLEKTLPDWGVTLFGVRHSLNPGNFNKKEHMLITIMASISITGSYTSFIVWIQAMPQWFNQPWATNFGYMILIALSANFIGYSLAGITRRFLVYPAHCAWPQALVTIALNASFHNQGNANNPVAGPLKSVWRLSRLRFFSYLFLAMFLYFWIPNSLFMGLSLFSWMTWIAPNNRNLATIAGVQSGLGLNPLPTFDWNVLTFFVDPLAVPFFSTFNIFLGTILTLPVIAAVYYTNGFNTAYIPIISNQPWDNTAQPYNVSAVVTKHGLMDTEKYQAYSPPYLSAGSVVVYISFFAMYAAALTHGFLYSYSEIKLGFVELWNSFRKKKDDVEDERVLDVHNRLMRVYKEVPEWWYMIVLVFSVSVGCAGLASYPTYTSPAVVIYGLILCLVFLIPTGIIFAMTGVQIALDVLAEFIGGSFFQGNALATCFFQTFGMVTCTQAQAFAKDLKLAHYVKIPPRVTFFAQMVPTLATTLVAVGILHYQITLKDVCTPDAPFRFYCPSETIFFSAAVIWGTVGPKRLFGPGGQYTITLIGFPIGALTVVAFWYLGKKYPTNVFIRKVHPVILMYGGTTWVPYNLSYVWPAVPIAWASWIYIRSRFLGLWAKVRSILSFFYFRLGFWLESR